MAARKPKKPKRSNTVPQTAQEKAAHAALTQAQQLNLEQQSARTSVASKGAFKGLKLRSGGSDLQRYNMGRFADDPFPTVTPPSSGGGGGGGGRPHAPRSGGGGRGRGRGGQHVTPAEARRRRAQQQDAQRRNERPGTMNGPNATELRQERERIAREKAAAAAAARKKAADAAALKKKRQAARDAGGGVTRSTGGKTTQS